MESYEQVFEAFDAKIKAAEQDKINAEKERDAAFDEIKIIRQRYINIIGSNKLLD